jgi:hypothetical protein
MRISAKKTRMNTTHIAGTELREDDEEIVKVLGRIREGAGRTMRIGIRNHGGIIYREVEAAGMSNFFNAVNCLLDREFIDELKDSPPWDGYDAIFEKG